MSELIRQLEEQSDIVILVTSPVLSSAESLLLTSKSDGVVLIIRSGETRQGIAKEAIASLQSIDANVVGAVFSSQTNRIELSPRASYRAFSQLGTRAVNALGGHQRGSGQVLPSSHTDNIVIGESGDSAQTKAITRADQAEDLAPDKGILAP